MKRGALGLAAVAGLVAPLALVTPAHAATVAAPYDLDGDGRAELVVGAFTLRVGSVRQGGGVVVLPGSAKGVSLKEQVITQASRGVPGSPEVYDQFGYAVASADFDADGYADLAIGAPSEKIGGQPQGSVTVVYGSSKGLDTRTATLLAPAGSSYLGSTMVAGDFTGDGYPDLAVSAPDEDLQESPVPSTGAAAGVVRVFRGGPKGITSAGLQELRGRRGPDANDSYFGQQLAAGDLDRDGVDDLVVGSIDSYVADVFGRRSSVSVCLGAAGGPKGCTVVRDDPYFASPTGLAVGNVTGSATPEIVVASGDDTGDLGRVEILRLKDSDPLTVVGQADVTAVSAGVPGSQDEQFGSSVAVGDVDHDGYADLAIGAAGARDDRGRVVVVHGGRDGYATSGNQVFDQSTKGVPGRAQRKEFFGQSVALLDHDGDGNLDLDVGTPGENHYAGAVTALRGSADGITAAGAKTFGLKTLGYAHPDKARFGYTVGR